MAKNPRDLRAAKLVPPDSYAIRRTIVHLASSNYEYGLAAALGVSAQGMGRFRIPWDGSKPAQYAERVIDELYQRSENVGELLYGRVDDAGTLDKGPGLLAYEQIQDSLITEAEVAAAEGNSEAPEGA